jgi:hypothetical protein
VIRLYTNGPYDIVGVVFRKRLYGVCVRSEFEYVIRPWSWVSLPMFHLKSDSKPQFVPKKRK